MIFLRVSETLRTVESELPESDEIVCNGEDEDDRYSEHRSFPKMAKYYYFPNPSTIEFSLLVSFDGQ